MSRTSTRISYTPSTEEGRSGSRSVNAFTMRSSKMSTGEQRTSLVTSRPSWLEVIRGAGKTTVLTQHANIDLSQFLMINPDDIKEEMARRGMIPEIDGLSPMEASELAHEESSHLAKRLAHRAQADGKNLIWDITMSSEGTTAGRIDDLRKAGYARSTDSLSTSPSKLVLGVSNGGIERDTTSGAPGRTWVAGTSHQRLSKAKPTQNGEAIIDRLMKR